MKAAKIPGCHPDRKYYAKMKCAACYAKMHRETHPDHRSYMVEYLKKYREDNPERHAAYSERRRADPEKRMRDARTHKCGAYRAKYGITLDCAHELLKMQGGGCAICQKPLMGRQMNVDHDHATGAVRGLLCVGCNTGLGLLGDTADGLREALMYLDRANSTQMPTESVTVRQTTTTASQSAVEEPKP